MKTLFSPQWLPPVTEQGRTRPGGHEIIDKQIKHQHTEGCFWHVKETGSIQRTFGSHSPTDLTVSLVCGTVRLPKERCSLPKWSLWEKSVTCTHNPHSTGNHQGKIRVSVLLFGFSLSICYLNLAMCCNALCPKGLSICAVSVKVLGG